MTELRVAASNGDTRRMVQMLDGQFDGSQSSLRMRLLTQEFRAVLEEQRRRHIAEPEHEPAHIPLGDFEDHYRRHTGKELRYRDLGYPTLRDMFDPAWERPGISKQGIPGRGKDTPAVLTRSFTILQPFQDGGPPLLALQPGYNTDVYNITGGVPETSVRTPVDAPDNRGRTALWFAAAGGHLPAVRPGRQPRC
jgi:hypothetical protein